jgi:glycerophosphoryl diester phosphodiesterase
MHPFLRGLNRPLHASHRGGARLYPENTLLAFEAAVSQHRTQLLELDLQVTRDGELVVAHDPTVDRCTDGTGRIDALTFAELSRLDAGYHLVPDGETSPVWRGRGARISRFVEVLRALPQVRLNVELKTERALAPLVAVLHEEQALDRLCLGAEEDALAAKVVEALPDACCFFPRDALAAFILPLKGGEPPEVDPRYTVLDMPWSWEGVPLFDRALADAVWSRGLWVNAWTVDDPVVMRELLADGVGGIMTDRPDTLRAVLDGR